MARHTDKNHISNAVRNLFSILRLDKKDIVSIYFYAILGGFISLSLPLGIQAIVGFVQAGRFSTSMTVLIALVVVGVFLYGLLQVRLMQTIEKIEQKIFTRYALSLAALLPNINMEKMDGFHLPELINRYFDISILTKSLKKLLLEIPSALIQILFGLLLLSFYHPIFIGFGLVIIILLIFMLRISSVRGLETSIEESDYKYMIGGWLEEVAREIKTFKYGRKASLHLRKTDELVEKFLIARTDHFKILLTQYWSFISFKTLITAAMLAVGAVLLIDNQINVGQFVASEIVIIAIINSVEKLITSLDSIYDALTSVQKLEKVTSSPQEEGGMSEIAEMGAPFDIEFRNVSFGYEDEDEVLKKLNLQIPAGSIFAIAGSSGSGKSSVLRLLTGSYKDFSGHLLINHVPIGNYKLESLREHTGVLMKQQDIFAGSILENITLGKESITIDNIVELADKLGLLQYVQEYKEGMHMQLTPEGKKIPAKLKHGILLLRAMVGTNKLLLLEEPFEHFNAEECQVLVDLLKSIKKETTVIIFTKFAAVAERCELMYELPDHINKVGN